MNTDIYSPFSVRTAYPTLHGLIASGLEQDRRALRVNVADLEWQFSDESTLNLSFSLPAGSYATAVLREIISSN